MQFHPSSTPQPRSCTDHVNMFKTSSDGAMGFSLHACSSASCDAYHSSNASQPPNIVKTSINVFMSVVNAPLRRKAMQAIISGRVMPYSCAKRSCPLSSVGGALNPSTAPRKRRRTGGQRARMESMSTTRDRLSAHSTDTYSCVATEENARYRILMLLVANRPVSTCRLISHHVRSSYIPVI